MRAGGPQPAAAVDCGRIVHHANDSLSVQGDLHDPEENQVFESVDHVIVGCDGGLTQGCQRIAIVKRSPPHLPWLLHLRSTLETKATRI